MCTLYNEEQSFAHSCCEVLHITWWSYFKPAYFEVGKVSFETGSTKFKLWQLRVPEPLIKRRGRCSWASFNSHTFNYWSDFWKLRKRPSNDVFNQNFVGAIINLSFFGLGAIIHGVAKLANTIEIWTLMTPFERLGLFLSSQLKLDARNSSYGSWKCPWELLFNIGCSWTAITLIFIGTNLSSTVPVTCILRVLYTTHPNHRPLHPLHTLTEWCSVSCWYQRHLQSSGQLNWRVPEITKQSSGATENRGGKGGEDEEDQSRTGTCSIGVVWR